MSCAARLRQADKLVGSCLSLIKFTRHAIKYCKISDAQHVMDIVSVWHTHSL